MGLTGNTSTRASNSLFTFIDKLTTAENVSPVSSTAAAPAVLLGFSKSKSPTVAGPDVYACCLQRIMSENSESSLAYNTIMFQPVI